MTTIEIPDEIRITTIQRVFSKQTVEIDRTPGLIDIGIDAFVKPEQAAIIGFMLNQHSVDVEVEVIIRKKK